MNFPFDAGKAAEAAHLFLRLERKQPTVLKLVKLLYLAERESIRRRNLPLFGGEYFSLRHGPVPSEAYDLIKGEGLEGNQACWDRLVSPRNRQHLLEPRGEFDPESLSRAEIKMIEEVHAEHEDKTAWDIREWCHEHVPEYEEIESGRRPIRLTTVAVKVEADPSKVEDEAQAANFFKSVFAS